MPVHGDTKKTSFKSDNPAKKGGAKKENPVMHSGGKGSKSDNPLFHPGNKMAKK